jgi:hypothetical protein
LPIKSSLTSLPNVLSPTHTITDSSFVYDPAKTITRTTLEAAFPTVTRRYAQPYPTGDQIRERGKNHSAVTEGEMFSDLWMDDLIYVTTIHASHHLCANSNLDGYVVTIIVFGISRLLIIFVVGC